VQHLPDAVRHLSGRHLCGMHTRDVLPYV
jgi:hypothetical protein